MKNNVAFRLILFCSVIFLAGCNFHKKAFRSFNYRSMQGEGLLESVDEKRPYVEVTPTERGLELEIFIPSCKTITEKWIKKTDYWYSKREDDSGEVPDNMGVIRTGLLIKKYIFHDTVVTYSTNFIDLPPHGAVDLEKIASTEGFTLIDISVNDSISLNVENFGEIPTRHNLPDKLKNWCSRVYAITSIKSQHNELIVKELRHSRTDTMGTGKWWSNEGSSIMLRLDGITAFHYRQGINICNSKTAKIYEQSIILEPDTMRLKRGLLETLYPK